jgi:hypothetical protein
VSSRFDGRTIPTLICSPCDENPFDFNWYPSPVR